MRSDRRRYRIRGITVLRSLNIENIAVIEKCNIEFDGGFNVLTGETGAGKSIIIDSINAVTGQRTSKELVRTGCDKAVVSAVFDNVQQHVIDALAEYGISADDRSVIMQRSISKDGRNVCRINGSTVNVSLLRDIGAMLVSIHGQHDNQALLDPETHCSFIDLYGGRHSGVLDDYRSCYEEFKNVRRQLKALVTDDDEKRRKSELARFSINEISAANIRPGELAELTDKRQIMRNAEKLREMLEQTHCLLAGTDDDAGAVSLASQASQALTATASILPKSKPLSERLSAASDELSDIMAEIRELCDTVTFDPGELDQCEQRIDLLTGLIKKYGGSEQAVIDHLTEAERFIADTESSDERITELEAESARLEELLIEKGAVLTAARRKTAGIFAEKVCDILKYLEMPNVVFSTNFRQGTYTANGCDEVEFYISANKGQDAGPLAKVASGGELSRIMLSIKSVMNLKNDADTLIFDEIDTGISGKAADKVGRQLKRLSHDRQVLCVTHLAQIAAAADLHFKISKSTKNNNTYTAVHNITGDDRIREIARIMSGGEMTDSLYKSAKELINDHTS